MCWDDKPIGWVVGIGLIFFSGAGETLLGLSIPGKVVLKVLGFRKGTGSVY